MAGKAAANAQQREREQDERIAAASTQPAAAAPLREAAPAQEDLITQLKRLAELKNGGLLTDEEFALAKQKLLTAQQ
jgi:hypothetical protein